jgi:transcriptional regulator of acetoin/glycerol metabolism
MLTTIAKRIQSRLSRSGVKVSLSEIKVQCEAMIKDIENPTENELLAVQEYFLESATQLTVIPDDVDSVDTAINTESIQDIEDVHTASIQELDNQEGLAIAPPQTEQPAPLATTNKSELVTATANQMGIVLNATEISLIAENISNSSDDFDQDIDSIKAAIMAFINHKSMINQSKINELINEVREVVSEKNSQNSQLLSDGLKQINSDIQEANRAFKSNVALCITAFDIPALKAG